MFVKHNLVEDYRPGYPRFTALLSAYEPYFLCRRFSKLRARVLFLKQDRLSVLEERLERIDHEEASPLFLGKLRCDRNLERTSLLSDIESGLADYGKYGSGRSFSPADQNRPLRREHVPNDEFKPCSTERRQEPAELAGWQWQCGSSGEVIPPSSSRTSIPYSS